MTASTKIPESHPRAESLKVREILSDALNDEIVVPEGLIAHGRGEAFDYLIGEKTIPQAKDAIRAATALMLLSKRSVISVNGNVSALVSNSIAELADLTRSQVEVNLFYRSDLRVKKIANILRESGIREVLGDDEEYRAKDDYLESERQWIDNRGILLADVVLIPLEDGDRTESLKRIGKQVIAIDLNPLSRTSQEATITIVDNVTRAIPEMVSQSTRLRDMSRGQLVTIIERFHNNRNLASILRYLTGRLEGIANRSDNME